MPLAAPPQPFAIKRRAVPEELREALAAADRLVELVLIFDTSGGKKGAFGGLGSDARDSTERTIDDIIAATIPGVKIEQRRIDNISVFAEPSYFIVLLVSSDDKAKVLGPHTEVHQTITYHIHGRDATVPLQKRSDVAIVITTPDRVPYLAMFGDRLDKSTPAGGLQPGTAIVVYIPDTREIRLQTPLVQSWLMDDALTDVANVLTSALQPHPGYTIMTILGQPVRLGPKTPGGVGIGISIKFWLVPPPHLDPRDINSITGALLPGYLLIPRRYVLDEASKTYESDWMHDPYTTPTQPYLRVSSRARSAAAEDTTTQAMA